MYPDDPFRIWQHIHGATTHFPIALVIVSVVFDAGSLLFKKTNWRTVGFWLLLCTAVMLFPAVLSGLYGIYVDPSGMENYKAEGYNHVRTMNHRNAALIGGGILLIPAIWRAVKRDDLSTRAYTICVLLALVATAVIMYTGFQGAYVPKGV